MELAAGDRWLWPPLPEPPTENGIYVMTDPRNPQSQSQPGKTNENPNEDVNDGNQSTIQPGGEGDSTQTTGGETQGDAATGNAAGLR